MARTRGSGALVLVLCFIVFALNHERGPLPDLRLALFDSYQQMMPRKRESAPVTIVAIDEKSLQKYGQWPWPRDLIADLLLKTLILYPVSMGLDIIMAEPDRFSPDKWPQLDKAPQDVQNWVANLADNDEELGAIMGQLPMAMGVAGLEEGPLDPTRPLSPAQLNGVEAEKWLRHYPSELRSLPALEKGAWGHGLLSVDPDPDGIVRRIPLAALLGDRVAPSLDLEVLRIAVGANWFSLNGTDKGVQSAQVGDLVIPTQNNASLWVHYTPSLADRFVSAADILDETVEPDRITNKIVLIGVTGLGLIDYPATPIAPRMSGVEVRAQLLENIFDQKILSRPNWAFGVEIGLLLVIAGLAVAFVPVLSPKISPVIWLGVLGSCLFGGFVFYKEALVLIDVASPALGGSLVFVTMLSTVLVEKDRLNKLFKRDLELQRQREAKLAGELEGAKRIQMGILPDTSRFKDPRFDICAFLEPAKDVGGDLYDVFMIDEDHLFFLVGDVAGKGIPASLFMALGKSLYKSAVLRRQTDIAQIMSEANEEIARDNPEMLFITAFAGILNLNTGHLQYCNAGHDAPHLFVRAGPVTQLDGIGGPPLCILEDMIYPGEETTLRPAQSLLIITDGVTEAMNHTGDLYSTERLDQFVEGRTENQSAGEIVDDLYHDVKDHADGAEASDDITIMALTWTPPSSA